MALLPSLRQAIRQLARAIAGTYVTVVFRERALAGDRDPDGAGSQVSNILAYMILRGLRPVIFGVTLGALAAFAVSRVMTNMLNGVSSSDL